ncbi:phage tail terminator-like protein [Psychrobacter namhaensis]|uniref:Phage tail terminator-like protein n=1 Tax=Psychrobacter namhaensis TaxID=292734 RepID=A0ABW8L4N2_9GAMM
MINDLLKAIYAEGLFAVPLSMPNRTFNTSGMDMWGKWQLMPTSTYRGNLRDIERAGILQITLFVPIGTDDTLIDDKAKAIAAHFGTEKAHMVDGHNVLIMSSHIEPAMPDSDGKWYMTPISIEYEII